MIAAKLQDDDGNQTIMLVLEPSNIEKLKNGEPLTKWLNEFLPELQKRLTLMVCYTPDAEWVDEQMKAAVNPKSPTEFAEILAASLQREPVVRDAMVPPPPTGRVM